MSGHYKYYSLSARVCTVVVALCDWRVGLSTNVDYVKYISGEMLDSLLFVFGLCAWRRVGAAHVQAGV